jgi:hypothetical protein
MLGLSTIDSHGLRVLDLHRESGLALGAGWNGDEAGVELATRRASLVGSARCHSVVLVQELELDGVTDSGLDRRGREDELLVSSDFDVDGRSESEGGVEKSNEGGLGEHVDG